MNSLKNYLYIDENMLNMYLDQIQVKFPTDYKRIKSIELALSGPKVNLTEESAPRDLNNCEKIEALMSHLEKYNLLGHARPKHIMSAHQYHKDHRPFVIETMTATKVIFPKISLKNLVGVKEFAVWISDPNPETLIDQYPNVGSFLYLTEMRLDKNEYQWSSRGENYLHPIDKFVSIGAVKSNTKRITSLYQKRYTTDEQFYILNNCRKRVMDLLGYPIYIAEELGNL